MSKSSPISVRLPAEAAEEFEAFAAEEGLGPSAALRTVVKEWLAVRRFPDLEFRDTVWGRRAALRGGPEVWKVVGAWKEYDDETAFYEHFGWANREALEQAIAYYESNPEPVERVLARNRRLAAAAERDAEL